MYDRMESKIKQCLCEWNGRVTPSKKIECRRGCVLLDRLEVWDLRGMEERLRPRRWNGSKFVF